MRIAVFCGEFPAISETFIIQEICQLLDEGNEVVVFSKKRGANTYINKKFEDYKLTDRTIYLYSSPKNKLRGFSKSFIVSFKNLHKIPTLIRRIGFWNFVLRHAHCFSFYKYHAFDIIHCHFAVIGDLAVQLRNRKIITGRIVTSFHGSGLVTLNSDKGIYPELIQKGDLFIANSNFTAKVAIDKGYPRKKIVYIPAQFDKDKFQNTQSKKYPKDKIIIVSVGRLIPFKGFIYGVKAIKDLLQKGYTNIEYRIIGEGPTRGDIENEIQKYNLQNYVTLLGQQTSEVVKKELEYADIYIMPGIIDKDGRAEAQGVVLQEAQAMKLPVIASSVGGMVEGIRDGETGFLVTQKDTVALADKISWFLKNQDKIEEFGSNGRAFVLKHFNSENSIKKLIACYHQILEN